MPPPRIPLGGRTGLSHLLLLLLLSLILPARGGAQESQRLFPPRDLLPGLLAGPRDPVSSATLFAVPRNPSAHGAGMEVEVSLGTVIPVLLLSGSLQRNPVVLGIEAAAFARFGLQVLERELVATDWLFAIPIVWHHEEGWTRLRYYHSSAHMGDEYNRRFGEPGFNASRDAAELLFFRNLAQGAGAWAGVRYGYNVHPQEDRKWVLRSGAQVESLPDAGPFLPFLAGDLEFDQEAGWRPRVEVRVGSWLPRVGERRRIRLSLVALNGPTPLGQFDFRPITQIGISLQGDL